MLFFPERMRLYRHVLCFFPYRRYVACFLLQSSSGRYLIAGSAYLLFVHSRTGFLPRLSGLHGIFIRPTLAGCFRVEGTPPPCLLCERNQVEHLSFFAKAGLCLCRGAPAVATTVGFSLAAKVALSRFHDGLSILFAERKGICRRRCRHTPARQAK